MLAVVIITVAIVAPLASLLCFFWLLGRHSRRFGPIFRVDSAGSVGTVTGPFTAQVPVAAGSAAEAAVATDAGPEHFEVAEIALPRRFEEQLPEEFDLGPTFEEERKRKEESIEQQENAVLEQLFEQNLRLHEQIEQAHDSQGQKKPE